MLPVLLLMTAIADWVPMRWTTADPDSLKLLEQTPVNCLLMERKTWSASFVSKAKRQGIVVLGMIRSAADAKPNVQAAKEQGLAGVVLEGAFADADAAAVRSAASEQQLIFVALPPRAGIRYEGEIAGTMQGLWPGIRPVDENDKSHAAPTAGPWIDTNGGFLRFARAMHRGTFWMANTPPEKQVLPVDRYLQAIADASMLGARWVVALDSGFTERLLASDSGALKDWKRICAYLRFYEDRKQWRALPPFAHMAVVQDASSGALLSGSVLDMIGVKHTPVRPVPAVRLSEGSLRASRMALNLDPAGLTEAQKETLKEFTSKGGTILNGPPGWKMPATSKDGLTVDKEEVEKLDQIWKELNSMIGRQNLGVRLFNVSSMLSYFQISEDGRRAVLHLVNYSGYPIENVTAHVLGKFKRAYVDFPESPRKPVETYDVDEGAATGIDLDRVPVAAMVVLEKE
ncbi:MAG: hypothetical protein JNL98_38535 [Bryobacterales bacterium]|nr:hypothetical protein [Bryobacterales bacterium]